MLEGVQQGQAADGRGLVLFVPAIADPTAPTLSELTANGVKKITYGLAPDGFDWQTSIATITSGRYTLEQALELDGVITDTLEVKWVYNRTTPTVVETTLGTKGVTGFIVVRLGYPNDTAIAAGQKLNGVIPISTSLARDVPPTANSRTGGSVRRRPPAPGRAAV